MASFNQRIGNLLPTPRAIDGSRGEKKGMLEVHGWYQRSLIYTRGGLRVEGKRDKQDEAVELLRELDELHDERSKIPQTEATGG